MQLVAKSLITAALLAPLATADAQGGFGMDTGTVGQASNLPSIEAQVSEFLTSLGAVSQGSGVLPRDIEVVDDLLDDWFEVAAPTFPSSGPMRKMLAIYLDELSERARNAWVSQSQVAFLRQQIVEMQLEHALDQLIHRARQNDWTPAHFQAVRARLIQRAENAGPDPSSTYLRRRFEELANGATTRAQNAFAKRVEAFRLELIQRRLDNALAKLRGQMRKGEISPVGFRAMLSQLIFQARAAARS